MKMVRCECGAWFESDRADPDVADLCPTCLGRPRVFLLWDGGTLVEIRAASSVQVQHIDLLVHEIGPTTEAARQALRLANALPLVETPDLRDMP